MNAPTRGKDDSEQILDLLDTLDDEWLDARSGTRQSGHRDGHGHGTRLSVILGLAEEVRSLARAVVCLHRNDLAFESSALVRQAFECAVTAQWVGHNPIADAALADEYARNRRNMRKTWLSASHKFLREAADGIEIDEPPVIGAEYRDRARTFERLVGDLEQPEVDLYVVYRALSDQSHATFKVVDRYVNVDAERNILLGRRDEPVLDSDWLLATTARSVLWAGMAVHYIAPNKTWRNQMRRHARTLKTVPELPLTEEARWEADRKVARLVKQARTHSPDNET